MTDTTSTLPLSIDATAAFDIRDLRLSDECDHDMFHNSSTMSHVVMSGTGEYIGHVARYSGQRYRYQAGRNGARQELDDALVRFQGLTRGKLLGRAARSVSPLGGVA